MNTMTLARAFNLFWLHCCPDNRGACILEVWIKAVILYI